MFTEDLRALESLEIEHMLPDLRDHLEWQETTVWACVVGRQVAQSSLSSCEP